MLDDDRIFLELYQNLLESKGYDVFTTDNAYKFLMYGREIVPDMMFLDVNMPRMNGWEVLRRVVNDSVMQEIPVAMLTVNQDEDLAHAKGVAHVLYKPLAIDTMMDMLGSYCQGGRNHDLLLIDEYEPVFNTFWKAVRQKQCSCFYSHNFKAAKKYLQKNNPKKICVRYSQERYDKVKDQLPKDKTRRVDSLAEIERYLDEC